MRKWMIGVAVALAVFAGVAADSDAFGRRGRLFHRRGGGGCGQAAGGCAGGACASGGCQPAGYASVGSCTDCDEATAVQNLPANATVPVYAPDGSGNLRQIGWQDPDGTIRGLGLSVGNTAPQPLPVPRVVAPGS